MSVAIRFENISKQYRLGLVSTRTLSHDLNRWWQVNMLRREDPYLRVGETNDRSVRGTSEYVWALRDISLEVEQGEVLGIIGKNGAGKSTLLKILSRVTAPTTGVIRARGRIASLLEVGTGFHPEMTGRENIFMNGAIMGMTKAEIRRKLDEIIDFAGVERYIDTPVKRYSSGMTVRLGFAVAAHLEPEILVVDEVLAVGDAEFQKKAVGKMQDVSHKEGRTVLFVSHNMASIQALCNKGVLLDQGSVKYSGIAKEVIGKYLSGMDTSSLEKIEQLSDRSGNQKVVFSEFHIENSNQERVSAVLTGEDCFLVFTLKCNERNNQRVDVGFSLHNTYDDPIAVLYSSYNGFAITTGTDDFVTIKCLLSNVALSPKKLQVKGRITVNGEESDWPKDPLGEMNVEMGDFYKTGNRGDHGCNTDFLLSGQWSISRD